MIPHKTRMKAMAPTFFYTIMISLSVIFTLEARAQVRSSPQPNSPPKASRPTPTGSKIKIPVEFKYSYEECGSGGVWGFSDLFEKAKQSPCVGKLLTAIQRDISGPKFQKAKALSELNDLPDRLVITISDPCERNSIFKDINDIKSMIDLNVNDERFRFVCNGKHELSIAENLENSQREAMQSLEQTFPSVSTALVVLSRNNRKDRLEQARKRSREETIDRMKAEVSEVNNSGGFQE